MPSSAASCGNDCTNWDARKRRNNGKSIVPRRSWPRPRCSPRSASPDETRRRPALHVRPLLPRALLEAVEFAHRADDQTAAGEGGGGQGHLVEAVLAQHPELRAGLDHERLTVLAQAENLAAVAPG